MVAEPSQRGLDDGDAGWLEDLVERADRVMQLLLVVLVPEAVPDDVVLVEASALDITCRQLA